MKVYAFVQKCMITFRKVSFCSGYVFIQQIMDMYFKTQLQPCSCVVLQVCLW